MGSVFVRLSSVPILWLAHSYPQILFVFLMLTNFWIFCKFYIMSVFCYNLFDFHFIELLKKLYSYFKWSTGRCKILVTLLKIVLYLGTLKYFEIIILDLLTTAIPICLYFIAFSVDLKEFLLWSYSLMVQYLTFLHYLLCRLPQ